MQVEQYSAGISDLHVPNYDLTWTEKGRRLEALRSEIGNTLHRSSSVFYIFDYSLKLQKQTNLSRLYMIYILQRTYDTLQFSKFNRIRLVRSIWTVTTENQTLKTLLGVCSK